MQQKKCDAMRNYLDGVKDTLTLESGKLESYKTYCEWGKYACGALAAAGAIVMLFGLVSVACPYVAAGMAVGGFAGFIGGQHAFKKLTRDQK